jgi:GNAT superfamily N-acetyltransferase
VQVRSLGWRTDLMMRRLSGSVVTDQGDHLVVRTPHNPTHYWGNFLLLAEPPRTARGAHVWVDRFTAEFPDAQHVALGVDDPAGDVGDPAWWEVHGLSVDRSAVLVLDGVAPRARPVRDAGGPPPVLRRVETDQEWAALVDLREAVDERAGDPGHRGYVVRRLAEARALASAGRGACFAAFLDGLPRASLGVFTDGSGVARYQTVETHPDFRRRGYAGALVAVAGRYALGELGASRLVILADPAYVAIHLYRALGFVEVERPAQLERAPASAG